MRILLTGSSGHLGQALVPALVQAGHQVTPFDLPDQDVTSCADIARHALTTDLCIHLAGLKYADRAELDALTTTDVNVRGTANVATVFGPDVILASTCKAADPETVYGCTKLIAERIVLEHGGTVIRLVNVLGSPGSVTDIWDQIPHREPLPVTDCTRLFMKLEDTVDMFVRALEWPAGRYGPAYPRARHMDQIAEELHPDRLIVRIPRRRGDRETERLFAACETREKWQKNVLRIVGPHDPARSNQTRAAA